MKENNEIRFSCKSELKDFVDRIRKENFSELVKTSFYQKIFLLGLDSVVIMIKEKGQERTLQRLLQKNK